MFSVNSSLYHNQKLMRIKTSSWTPNGIVICNLSDMQANPKIISDGIGSAIIIWSDLRNGVDSKLYAQKINADGTIQWSNNGEVVCSADGGQSSHKITADGAGGAIIAWIDRRSTGNFDIYAQRINSNGITQWTPNGTAICTEKGIGDGSPPIIDIYSDGLGGAFITWSDIRKGGGERDIYVQRINSSGITQWTPNGTAICTVSNHQTSPRICRDGVGGVIIIWDDWRSVDSTTIYAQKVNSSGISQWTPNGIPISPIGSSTSHFTSSEIVPDGAGGGIIVYGELRLIDITWLNFIHTQRVNSSGNLQWLPNGTTIRGNFFYPSYGYEACSDGAGGVIMTWDDERGGSTSHDIYTQKVNFNGVTQWTPNGTAICIMEGNQAQSKICSDGAGGAILTWIDERGAFSEYDIYAQKINSGGNVQWTKNGVALCTDDEDQEWHEICSDGDGGAFITWVDFRVDTSGDIYAYRIESEGQIGDGDNGIISFGNFFIIFTIISIISFIVVIKRRKLNV